jgi:stage V sporulation protein B
VQKGSYLRNAAVLTASGLLLRLAGMGFRIWLAGALGEQGLGLYELVQAFYAMFVTAATAGVSVAATRLMAEELVRAPGAGRGMLRRLLAWAVGLGGAAAAAQFLLAGPAARCWLGDARAAAAIRACAPSLPFMAAAAVLRGFFLARRRVEPNALSQLAEQAFRIAAVYALLARTDGLDLGARCAAVLLGTSLSEMLSAALMALFYGRERRRAFGRGPAEKPYRAAARIWAILWPVEGARCLSSGLHTAENMLVPACLALYLADAGGRGAAVAQYGVLKGMALPLLFFPYGLLGTLATLLMPEITEAHVRGQKRTLARLLDRMLALTMFAALLAGAGFAAWAGELAALLYHSAEAGFYLAVLAPVMPLMYLESMVDGALKGLGEQKASFGYTAWDSALRIAGVMLLLPRFGMKGFLFVILASNTYTCLANLRRLLAAAGLRLRLWGWFGAPLAAAVPAVLAGRAAAQALAGGGGWARLAAGGAVTAAAWLALSWPLGLGRMLAGLRPAKKESVFL